MPPRRSRIARASVAAARILAISSLGACGGASATTADAGVDAAPRDLVTVADGEACPGPDAPDGAVCVRRVEARILDEDGAPLEHRLATVCGAVCYYGVTDAAGKVTVPVGEGVRLADYSFLLHGRPDLAGYCVPLLAPDERGVIAYPSPLSLPRLPADGPVMAVDGTAQRLASGGAVLDLPAGLLVEPSVEDVADGPIRLRARAVPRALWPAFRPGDGLAPGPAWLGVWALTPFEAVLTPPKADPSLSARLSLTAPLGLPVGQAVDLLGVGNLLWSDGPPAGTLALLGTARVSVDGGPLETDAGFRLPFLTWIVVRTQGP